MGAFSWYFISSSSHVLKSLLLSSRPQRWEHWAALFWTRWWFTPSLKKDFFFVGMWCFSFKSLFLFCLSLPSVLFHTWDFSILILHSLSWHHCLVFQLNVLGVFSCSENNPLNECCELSVISLVASGHEWCQHLSMRSTVRLWYEAENLQWRRVNTKDQTKHFTFLVSNDPWSIGES